MRYPSIDLMRTIAIIIMVLVHFGENLSGFTISVAGMGAPQFIFLSGVSYFLWSRGRQSRGISETEITKISVRRGLFVFCVGIAFNVLVWLPEDTFNWDVLTFIGSALLVLGCIRHMPLAIPIAIAIGSALVSPILRDLAGYSDYWQNRYYDYDITLSDITTGYLAVGYFPIFPWLTFSLTGFVVASLLFEQPDDADAKLPSVWPTVVFGLCLVATSLVLLSTRTYFPAVISTKVLTGWSMFPPSFEYVLAMLGATLTLLGLGHQYIDRSPQTIAACKPFLTVCQTFSQYSFTIYILHHIVHLYPLWIYAIVTGNEPTVFWGEAMPAYQSLSLAVVFLVSLFLLLRWIGPNFNFGIESAMRWLCD